MNDKSMRNRILAAVVAIGIAAAVIVGVTWRRTFNQQVVVSYLAYIRSEIVAFEKRTGRFPHNVSELLDGNKTGGLLGSKNVSSTELLVSDSYCLVLYASNPAGPERLRQLMREHSDGLAEYGGGVIMVVNKKRQDGQDDNRNRGNP